MSESVAIAVTTVRANDVLILSTPQSLRNDQKESYLNWFRGSLAGSSLQDCKVILLDGGAEVQVFRGEQIAE